jgi:1-deoxy-D-xylulose-5-phosphate reductoisomerase
MAVCNAANEIAVAAFLDNGIRFTDIPLVIEHTLEQVDNVEPVSLSVVENADAQARQVAAGFLVDFRQTRGMVKQV